MHPTRAGTTAALRPAPRAAHDGARSHQHRPPPGSSSRPPHSFAFAFIFAVEFKDGLKWRKKKLEVLHVTCAVYISPSDILGGAECETDEVLQKRGSKRRSQRPPGEYGGETDPAARRARMASSAANTARATRAQPPPSEVRHAATPEDTAAWMRPPSPCCRGKEFCVLKGTFETVFSLQRF